MQPCNPHQQSGNGCYDFEGLLIDLGRKNGGHNYQCCFCKAEFCCSPAIAIKRHLIKLCKMRDNFSASVRERIASLMVQAKGQEKGKNPRNQQHIHVNATPMQLQPTPPLLVAYNPIGSTLLGPSSVAVDGTQPIIQMVQMAFLPYTVTPLLAYTFPTALTHITDAYVELKST